VTEKKTVAGAYQKIEAHEDLCAERYRNIHETLGELKDGMKWAIRLIVGTALGAAAFLLQQVIGG
jgi:hypothetical protein